MQREGKRLSMFTKERVSTVRRGRGQGQGQGPREYAQNVPLYPQRALSKASITVKSLYYPRCTTTRPLID